MNPVDVARLILPASAVAALARVRKKNRRARIEALVPLTEKRFAEILTDHLKLRAGDTVYVGSSIDQLNLDFPFYKILSILRATVGTRGNILFPTYPNRSPMSSAEFLRQGKVFDVRRSPSYTGLLSEFARRQKDAVRSLHPTKSVVALGPDAEDMTTGHELYPYPYDTNSPYRKLVEAEAKIIGLGVWTEYLSFVYTIDDALKDNPPVETYLPEIFTAQCINREGETISVATRAHDMKRVVHDVPAFMKREIAPEICEDLLVDGMRFFRADARPLFDKMLALARRGITVYPARLRSPAFRPDA